MTAGNEWLDIEQLTVGFLETNCYIVHDKKTGKGAVVDPGDEPEQILERVTSLDISLKWIINTHGHIDHIGGNKPIKEATGAKIVVHRADAPMLMDGKINGAELFEIPFEPTKPDVLITTESTFNIGSLSFQIFHTPGHSPGSISFYGYEILLSGDLLFRGGVGRWDLPGGSKVQLMSSLQTIMTLPGGTIVYPGHGDLTNVTEERDNIKYILKMKGY